MRVYISQSTFGMTPHEVGEAFSDFWSPFWNRDSVEDNIDDTSWENFHSILDQIPECDEMTFELNNPTRWFDTVHRLKRIKPVDMMVGVLKIFNCYLAWQSNTCARFANTCGMMDSILVICRHGPFFSQKLQELVIWDIADQ